MPREYCFNRENHTGYGSEPCDILIQHFKSDNFRTIAIRAEEWDAWNICNKLNDAYKAGREDAMRDLRNFIGVEK